MSADNGEMETVSAAGNIHPGFCWGQWEAGVPECGKCRIAEKCSDATKRLTNKATRQQPIVPKPAPSKPAPAKPVEAPPAPKAEPKPEPPPEKTPEVKPTPEVAKTPETPLEMLVRVVKAKTNGTHIVKDAGPNILLAFLRADKSQAALVCFIKETGRAKMRLDKIDYVLNSGFSEADVNAALKDLL